MNSMTYVEVLNKNVPLKQKIVCANHAPYITKALRKAIMRRSNLEGKYLMSRYELLITKLHVYGLPKPAVKLVYSYFNNW